MPRRIAICLFARQPPARSRASWPRSSSCPTGPTSAEAAVTKSFSGGGGGGGNVSGAGDRLGNLLSGWAVPVLTVLAGCLLVGALASRNIGTSVGIVVITLLGLIFLLAPQSVESFAKGIASTVF